jgi:hypothetical protein
VGELTEGRVCLHVVGKARAAELGKLGSSVAIKDGKVGRVRVLCKPQIHAVCILHLCEEIERYPLPSLSLSGWLMPC